MLAVVLDFNLRALAPPSTMEDSDSTPLSISFGRRVCPPKRQLPSLPRKSRDQPLRLLVQAGEGALLGRVLA